MSESQRPEGAMVMVPDREVLARALFREMYPGEDWGLFDARYEIRGGYHPMQDRAFALADIALTAMIAATQQSPISGEGAEPDLRETIFGALRSYEMTNMGDGDGDGFPLVDLMSNDGTTIATGEAEMRVLADAIGEAIENAPPVPSVSGEGGR